MVKKGITILLFVLVTAGFLFGFITYNRRLSKMMDQEISQTGNELPMEEPDPPVEEPQSEEPGSVIDQVPPETPAEGEALILIPNIVGLHEDDAVEKLKNAGLVPEIHLEYIEGVEEEFVFYQRPPKNKEVPKGTVVSFSVSRGPYGSSEEIIQVKVPDLSGKTFSQAESIISSLKLKIRSEKIYSETVASGQIISQDVPSGKEVDEGSTVAVKISSGKELVAVPGVINLKEAEAKTVIESRGLKMAARFEHSDKAAGTVISQSPSSGNVSKGTSISVTVSSGAKAPIEPPEPEEPEEPVEPENPEEPVETPAD